MLGRGPGGQGVWTGEIRAGPKYSGSGEKKQRRVEGACAWLGGGVAEEEEDDARRFGAESSVAPRERQRTDHGYVKKT